MIQVPKHWWKLLKTGYRDYDTAEAVPSIKVGDKIISDDDDKDEYI